MKRDHLYFFIQNFRTLFIEDSKYILEKIQTKDIWIFDIIISKCFPQPNRYSKHALLTLVVLLRWELIVSKAISLNFNYNICYDVLLIFRFFFPSSSSFPFTSHLKSVFPPNLDISSMVTSSNRQKANILTTSHPSTAKLSFNPLVVPKQTSTTPSPLPTSLLIPPGVKFLSLNVPICCSKLPTLLKTILIVWQKLKRSTMAKQFVKRWQLIYLWSQIIFVTLQELFVPKKDPLLKLMATRCHYVFKNHLG